MKNLILAILCIFLPAISQAKETFSAVEMYSGSPSDLECSVLVRYQVDGLRQTDRLNLSCAELRKAGLVRVNADGNYVFSAKARRMKGHLADTLYKVKPALDLVSVRDCVPVPKTSDEVVTIILQKKQAVCLSPGEYKAFLIGDVSTWRLIGTWLIPSTISHDNVLYLQPKDGTPPQHVHVKFAS